MAKLKLEEVAFPHPKGSYTREAYVVGDLAVIPDFDLLTVTDHFTVTHIQSGCYIAKYGKLNDAVEFSRRAQELFDFDAYIVALSNGKLSAEWKDAIDDLRLLRESLPSYVRERDGEDVRQATVEYLKGLVNAQ